MTASRISILPSCPRRERPNIVPSRSVCRQLFGPVNHEQVKADLLRERRKLCDENTQTWNFDFENGIPLVGRYVWERICTRLTKDRPVSSFPDLASETGSSERLGLNLPSAEITTVATTTSPGMSDSTISNDVECESLESAKCDRAKPLRCLRKRKSSGKITGKSGCSICFRELTFVTHSMVFNVRHVALLFSSLACDLYLAVA